MPSLCDQQLCRGPQLGEGTCAEVPMASARPSCPSCGCQPVAANWWTGNGDCQSPPPELGSLSHQGQLFPTRQFVYSRPSAHYPNHIVCKLTERGIHPRTTLLKTVSESPVINCKAIDEGREKGDISFSWGKVH